MLRIGEFSQLCQVSVKTLRYYDDIDLFKPNEVDKFTSHRYYALNQLPEIHRIMALKDLGLSLDQIRSMAQDTLSDTDIRGILRFKEAELEQMVRETQQRLARVQFHLRMMETEAYMSNPDVVVKDVDAIDVMVMKSHEGIGPGLDAEVRAAVATGKIKHTGKFIQVYDGERMNDDWSNASFVLEVDPSQPDEDVSLTSMGTFKRERIAPAKAATMIVHGPKERTPQASFALLNRWAVDHGYRLCGESRAVFHHGPMHSANRDEWIIELQAIVEARA